MKKVAIIGGGISGISAAHMLQDRFEVSIFEAGSYLGGHTNTISVIEKDKVLSIDTGFIVLNDCNYALLHHLFDEWDVEIRWSDMSFSFYDVSRDFYYAGTDIFGLFAKKSNILSLDFYKFLNEIRLFSKIAKSKISSIGNLEINYTLGNFFKEYNFSSNFIYDFLLPMGSAIWSVPLDQILDFPAKSFFQFFKNHGLLDINDRPRWQTVVGGSKSYVEKFLSQFKGNLNLNASIKNVNRSNNTIIITDQSDENLKFDYVLFATHADTTLSLIESPTDQEIELLSAWDYQENIAILHTDKNILPPNKNAWASWNYYRPEGSEQNTSQQNTNDENSGALVTYYMNKLQGLDCDLDYFVSLNSEKYIDQTKIIKKINYTHPVYTKEAIASQSSLMKLQGQNNSFFSGSYFGYGFHEDGARSGMVAANSLLDFKLK